MRVLVCGGRDYKNRARAYAELDRLCLSDGTQELILIIGGANGADSLARDWYFARLDRIEYRNLLLFPAEWKEHGKAAGPIRNQAMIDNGHPEMVVAFPGGRGTADMVRRAKAAAIPVVEIRE